MTTSLRNRLLVGIIAGAVISLTIFSLTVYVAIRTAMTNQFDSSLASVTRILAASVELDGDEIELEFEVRQMPEFQNSARPTYYQLWGPNDLVAARSPLPGAGDLERLEGPLDELVFGKSRTPDNLPMRTVSLKFKPRTADGEDERHGHTLSTQTLTLAVARDMSDLLGQLRFLRWLLITAAITVTLLSVLIAALVVREGLAPLNAIAAQISAIDQENLTTRIDAASAPAEVLPIKDRLNDLLSRLEDAFKRERRFTADVAHELRTPLAGIRSTIEVTLTRTRNRAEHEKVLSDCLDIVENMQTMVNNLLMLARLDAKQVKFGAEQVHLAELVDSAWRPINDKALQRRITFENRVPPDMTCQSDREHLSIILRNLLENAAEYTNEAGRIRINARRTDDSVEVTLSNTGCELTDDQVVQVFDSFWRADSSRSEAAVHSGLGLALVKRMATALQGAITAQTAPPDIFKIRLILPLHRP